MPDNCHALIRMQVGNLRLVDVNGGQGGGIAGMEQVDRECRPMAGQVACIGELVAFAGHRGACPQARLDGASPSHRGSAF